MTPSLFTVQSDADAFISQCFRIDRLMDQLAALRANHFGVTSNSVSWADVGSACEIARRLEMAVAFAAKTEE